MNKKSLLILITVAITAAIFNLKTKSDLPIVAIANYGPHASLNASIEGLKDEMKQQGFIENQTIRYEMADVGFDPALIPQMVVKLKNNAPKVMVVLATPIAQFAKGKIKDIPLVYSAITDPIKAGLLKDKNHADGNMVGSSDMQDLGAFLKFAKTILKNAKTVGLLYATAESNDLALLNMMNLAASIEGMNVVAIPVNQSRDVVMNMQAFKGKVDLIYVGTSGPIQPALPTIAQEAKKMNIPVFNSESQAVKDGLALASFGVDYHSVGRNTGKLVADLLKGVEVGKLTPLYPTFKDHHGIVSRKKAAELGVVIPANIKIVE